MHTRYFKICFVAVIAFAQAAFADDDTATQSCIATESELHAAFVKAGLGVMGANNRTIAVANAGTTKVISTTPHTYSISDAKVCSLLK